MTISSRRPDDREVPLSYQRDLIAKLEGDDVLTVLQQQLFWMCELGSHVCAEQADKIHAPYQWTIRQVFEHCVDAERVFGYRMLRAAAGDATPMTGWDENAYADARFGLGTLSNLISEMGAIRQSNLLLLRRIQPAAWGRSVQIDGHSITVRAMAWVSAAHLAHHFEIIQARCQISVDRRAPSM